MLTGTTGATLMGTSTGDGVKERTMTGLTERKITKKKETHTEGRQK